LRRPRSVSNAGPPAQRRRDDDGRLDTNGGAKRTRSVPLHSCDAATKNRNFGLRWPYRHCLVNVRHNRREPNRTGLFGGKGGRNPRHGPCSARRGWSRCYPNSVAPGLTDTPAVRGDLTPEQIEAARHAIPIGRLGKPEDIADTIAFLALMRAGYITRAVIEANGGRQPP
jgi:hypothetical protein